MMDSYSSPALATNPVSCLLADASLYPALDCRAVCTASGVITKTRNDIVEILTRQRPTNQHDDPISNTVILGFIQAKYHRDITTGPGQLWLELRFNRTRHFTKHQRAFDSLTNDSFSCIQFARMSAEEHVTKRGLRAKGTPKPSFASYSSRPPKCELCEADLDLFSSTPGETTAHLAIACTNQHISALRLSCGLSESIAALKQPGIPIAAVLAQINDPDSNAESQVLYDLLIGATIPLPLFKTNTGRLLAVPTDRSLPIPEAHRQPLIGVVTELTLLQVSERITGWPTGHQTSGKRFPGTILAIDRSNANPNKHTYSILWDDGEFYTNVKGDHIYTPPTYTLPDWTESEAFLPLGRFLAQVGPIRAHALPDNPLQTPTHALRRNTTNSTHEDADWSDDENEYNPHHHPRTLPTEHVFAPDPRYEQTNIAAYQLLQLDYLLQPHDFEPDDLIHTPYSQG